MDSKSFLFSFFSAEPLNTNQMAKIFLINLEFPLLELPDRERFTVSSKIFSLASDSYKTVSTNGYYQQR